MARSQGLTDAWAKFRKNVAVRYSDCSLLPSFSIKGQGDYRYYLNVLWLTNFNQWDQLNTKTAGGNLNIHKWLPIWSHEVLVCTDLHIYLRWVPGFLTTTQHRASSPQFRRNRSLRFSTFLKDFEKFSTSRPNLKISRLSESCCDSKQWHRI